MKLLKCALITCLLTTTPLFAKELERCFSNVADDVSEAFVLGDEILSEVQTARVNDYMNNPQYGASDLLLIYQSMSLKERVVVSQLKLKKNDPVTYQQNRASDRISEAHIKYRSMDLEERIEKRKQLEKAKYDYLQCLLKFRQ